VRGRKHRRLAGPLPGTLLRDGARGARRAAMLSHEQFFERLAAGEFQRVVVLTGAGVSTAAGIPDFRSSGGMFDRIRATWGDRFPEVLTCPEELLSRRFADAHAKEWATEVSPWIRQMRWEDADPTIAHHFCGWLSRQGWLRRIYTQNVDGVHLHPDVGVPPDLVVECHGALRDDSVVMYGDRLPARFRECCRADFALRAGGSATDLVLVLGTSLQVAPFCALPNMAPSGCARVLVSLNLSDCLVNDWSPRRRCGHDDGLGGSSTVTCASAVQLGDRRRVSLRPLWQDRKAGRRWEQLLVQASCDSFVSSFFASPAAQARGLALQCPSAHY